MKTIVRGRSDPNHGRRRTTRFGGTAFTPRSTHVPSSEKRLASCKKVRELVAAPTATEGRERRRAASGEEAVGGAPEMAMGRSRERSLKRPFPGRKRTKMGRSDKD